MQAYNESITLVKLLN